GDGPSCSQSSSSDELVRRDCPAPDAPSPPTTEHSGPLRTWPDSWLGHAAVGAPRLDSSEPLKAGLNTPAGRSSVRPERQDVRPVQGRDGVAAPRLSPLRRTESSSLHLAWLPGIDSLVRGGCRRVEYLERLIRRLGSPLSVIQAVSASTIDKVQALES